MPRAADRRSSVDGLRSGGFTKAYTLYKLPEPARKLPNRTISCWKLRPRRALPAALALLAVLGCFAAAVVRTAKGAAGWLPSRCAARVACPIEPTSDQPSPWTACPHRGQGRAEDMDAGGTADRPGLCHRRGAGRVSARVSAGIRRWAPRAPVEAILSGCLCLACLGGRSGNGSTPAGCRRPIPALAVLGSAGRFGDLRWNRFSRRGRGVLAAAGRRHQHGPIAPHADDAAGVCAGRIGCGDGPRRHCYSECLTVLYCQADVQRARAAIDRRLPAKGLLESAAAHNPWDPRPWRQLAEQTFVE